MANHRDFTYEYVQVEIVEFRETMTPLGRGRLDCGNLRGAEEPPMRLGMFIDVRA